MQKERPMKETAGDNRKESQAGQSQGRGQKWLKNKCRVAD